MIGAPPCRNRHARACGAAFLAAWLLGGLPLHAAVPAENAARLERLIEAAGIGHSARQIVPNVLGGIEAPEQGMPAPVRGALRDAAMQAYQPIPLLGRMRASLGAALSARQIDDTLAWLDSPLGRRITALENESSELAATARKKTYGKELKERPPTKSRSKLIGELNRALDAEELAAAIGESMIMATVLGMNAAQPAGQQVPADALRQKVKAGMPKMRQESDEAVAVGLHYTYRSLSDQDLESYLKFLRTPSGAAYSKSAGVAMRDAMLEANDRFMREIPQALARQKGAQKTMAK